MAEGEVLRLVAAVERESEYLLAEAVVTYAAARGAGSAPARGLCERPWARRHRQR